MKLSGYLVPLDFTSSKTNSLLLVPYYGACIHAPPPSQTILVQARQPVQIPKLSSAVEAKGIIGCSINTSEVGDSAYLLKLDSVREL